MSTNFFLIAYSISQTSSDEFKVKSQTPTAESETTKIQIKLKLSSSQYLALMRMDNLDERNFYE